METVLPRLLRLALELWSAAETGDRLGVEPRLVERAVGGDLGGWDNSALVRLARELGVDPARALGGGPLPVPSLVAFLREDPSGFSPRDAVVLRRALSRSIALREAGLRAERSYQPTGAPASRAWEAGYRAARRVRRDLGDEHGPLVDLRGAVEGRLGIAVVFGSLMSPRLEALAIADAEGAAIVLNRRLQRAAALLRRSVAHELCHLLFDPRDDSPLVDVIEPEDARPAVVHVGQRESREQRARAFAAELLIPKAALRTRFRAPARGADQATEWVTTTCREFGAPWELCVRHLGNHGVIDLADADRLALTRREVASPLGLGEPAAWRWARDRVAEGELSEGRAREIFGEDWERGDPTSS